MNRDYFWQFNNFLRRHEFLLFYRLLPSQLNVILSAHIKRSSTCRAQENAVTETPVCPHNTSQFSGTLKLFVCRVS